MKADPSQLEEFVVDSALGRIAGLRSAPVAAGAARVIALHGWLDNAASFIPLSTQLDPALDLVAIDLPGHGHSAHLGAGAEYTGFVAINAVLDVADALGWERFALLGHSMGAGIACQIAAAVPQRVTRLVAIEALGALSEDPGNSATRLRQSIAGARALPGKRLRVFADLDAPVRARMHANHLSAEAARLLVARGVRECEGGWVWRTDPRLTLPGPTRQVEAQVETLLDAIECPAQVILADPPQAYFPEPLRSQRARRLARGELHVLPGIHHLHMQRPAEVAATIGDFLSRTD